MPFPTQSWPQTLWVVRHGESAGNVAREQAEAGERERIELQSRDVDVPLSARGREQAQALGRWMAAQPEQPTVVWTSPYVRARQTTDLALGAAGLALPAVVDERLREREFGVLDGLTRRGIVARYPDEAARLRKIGKFYHRPPGGESWCDVLLRLRGAVDDVRRDAEGERVLLVAHQVVVLLVRYVVEHLDEQQILAIDAQGDVANCSLTSYRREPDGMVLERYRQVTQLADQDAPVTAEPGRPRAAR